MGRNDGANKIEGENMQHHEFYEGGAGHSSFDMNMQRPRIRELMLEAVKKPLTAIVANVGSGKHKLRLRFTKHQARESCGCN